MVALLFSCVATGSLLAQAPPASPTVAEQYLFAQANAERAQRGLAALRWDNALYRAADFHARQMAAHAAISHQFSGEPDLSERGRNAGAHFSMIAENVAEAPTAVEIHQAWMESSGHRANLLDANATAVGIRVLSRDGQLYAVEDFDRSVQSLSLDDQERTVAGALQNTASIQVLTAVPEARQTCAMESGYAGARAPWFVMRYTASDLNRLPDALKAKLASGKYRQAVVGACTPTGDGNFTAFNIAVLLYP